jgi:hypothetical protein
VRATWWLVRGPWVTRVPGAAVGDGAGVEVCTGGLGLGPAVGRGVGCGVAGGAVGPGAVGPGVAVGVAVGALESAGADGLAAHGTDGEAPGGLLVGAGDVPGVGVGEGAGGPARLPTATPASASATSQATGVLAAW